MLILLRADRGCGTPPAMRRAFAHMESAYSAGLDGPYDLAGRAG